MQQRCFCFNNSDALHCKESIAIGGSRGLVSPLQVIENFMKMLSLLPHSKDCLELLITEIT